MDGPLSAGPTCCAVLGSPIRHSLSPALHAAAYRHLGLDWEYGRYEVDEAGLPAFLAGLDERWRGLSLTMPLKRVALECVDRVSEVAARVEAVNTVVLGPDGRSGDNTDVPGIVAALHESDVRRVPSAAVLGGGATARSALAALAELTDAVEVYVRTDSRSQALLDLAARCGLACSVRPWASRRDALRAPLLVSTTPAGSVDDLAAEVTPPMGVLFDVVYDPWPTPIAAAWALAGGMVLGGMDLLVHQAALQVRLMTGRDVPVEVLREAVADATGRPPEGL